MRLRMLCTSASLVCALAFSGSASAIEVHHLHWLDGNDSSFDRHGDVKVDDYKPWQTYSDPACDSVDVTKITFSSGIGTSNSAHSYQSDSHPNHLFQRMDKFPSSHRYSDDSYSHWKNHDAFCTPVPEPQTYALLLAGLGAMTLVARWRKAQPSPTPA